MPELKSYTVMVQLHVEAESVSEAVRRAKDDLRGMETTTLDVTVVYCNGPVDHA